MKRIILIALTGVFLLGLSACGSVPTQKNDRSKIDKNYNNFMDKNQTQMQ